MFCVPLPVAPFADNTTLKVCDVILGLLPADGEIQAYAPVVTKMAPATLAEAIVKN
jgi:hypothetical protein